MQEEADAVLQPESAEFRGQRDEVIVVHPDRVVAVESGAKASANMRLTRK